MQVRKESKEIAKEKAAEQTGSAHFLVSQPVSVSVKEQALYIILFVQQSARMAANRTARPLPAGLAFSWGTVDSLP